MTRTAPAPSAIPVSALHGLPLLRSAQRDPLALLAGLRREHGTLVRIPVPGNRLYLLSEPDAIGEAFTRTHHEYAKGLSGGFSPLARILGQGLLTSNPPVHRRQRRLLSPIFHRARIAQYATTFAELAETAGQGWRDGEVRDIHRDLTELTLAIIARTVFDVDLASDVVGLIRHGVANNQPSLRRALLPYGRWVERLPLPANRRFERDRAQLDRVIYQLIAARRESAGDRNDVLSLLLAARDEETGRPMPDRQVRDEAVTLLLAGHETTADALAWTMHLLASNPATQDRLHVELAEVLGRDRTPDLADLPALRYTSAVWREALRLYPPAWLVIRRLVTDRDIAGHRLPAGALLALCAFVVHRDPRWWPDPDRFSPQRWLTEPVDRPRYSYFPFGGGPRQCIGNEFASMEGVLVLATLLRDWRIAPPPRPAPVRALAMVTLRPRDGVPVTLHRVQH